jgi:hypothetical protein
MATAIRQYILPGMGGARTAANTCSSDGFASLTPKGLPYNVSNHAAR